MQVPEDCLSAKTVATVQVKKPLLAPGSTKEDRYSVVLAHNCLRLKSLSIFDQRSNYHIYSSGLSDIITLDFQLKYILMKLKPCIIN